LQFPYSYKTNVKSEVTLPAHLIVTFLFVTLFTDVLSFAANVEN